MVFFHPRPPEPVYAQSSKLRPLPTRQSDQNTTSKQIPQQPPPQHGNPHPQQLSLRSDSGNPANFSRPALEKDPRNPVANQLPPYTRPPSVTHSPNRSMQRLEPPRRDQDSVTQSDGPPRGKEPLTVDPAVQRRVQDPRAATLGRVPNRYPVNREAGFRRPERPGDQTQAGTWMHPDQRRPPLKIPPGQPQYQVRKTSSLMP